MKVTIPRDAAHAAFAKASRSMGKKADVPILGDVLLSAHNDTMTVTATDGDRRITVAMLAEVLDPGEICVSGRTMVDALKKWPEGEKVTIDHPVDANDSRCVVACGRSRIRVSTLPASDFPDLEFGSTDIAFAMPGAELAEALQLCIPHVETDDTRYYLRGVAIGEDAQGDLVFVATDGHTLARKTTEMPEDGGGLTLRIVPVAAAEEIARVATDRKEEPVEISFSERAVHVDAGDTNYLSLLIDGTFPNYEAVIPRDFARSATVAAKDLIKAADRAAVVLRSEAKGIRLTMKTTEIAVTARLADAEAESAADAAFDGPEITVGVNVDYLRDCLAPFVGGQALLSFQEVEMSPIVITSGADDGVTVVIMPLKV
ncbi:DNA polymerase III subunit beta [Pleomorphomonas koreensis]|uniref:DNA polymerase III subunit beta n=1 Tax=Pleomorphomonas koreensis TaxID=257440 RepID=UPI0003F7182A|nr:DNA polymerase III subunit beta [Pleomorphomonas koreensis]